MINRDKLCRRRSFSDPSFFFKYDKKNPAENWLGDEEDVLTGFEWKIGSSRVTTGIHMWNKVFMHDFQDGRKVAIIVIDTQGTFDSKSTMQDCTTIFALSTLLSSVQILNLMNNIQEDDLQHLAFFSEYGRLVAAEEDDSPFQKLLVLVRDWNYPFEFQYGDEGGQGLIDQTFSEFDCHAEHRSLRRQIRKVFKLINCFLMPSPGEAVTSSEIFKGRLSEIKKEFREILLVLVPMLFAPENLIVKKINGNPVTATDFVNFLKSYLGVFQSGELPEPMALLKATAYVNNMKAVTKSKDFYSNQMQRFDSSFYQLNENSLKQQHEITKMNALGMMRSERLLGTEEYLDNFLEELNIWLDEKLTNFIRMNRGRMTITKILMTLVAVLGGGAAGTTALALSTTFAPEIIVTCGLPIVQFVLKLITRFRP